MARSQLKQQGLPKGLKRWLFRAPIYLYKARLGFLLGGRFVLIEHLGRKSGIKRSTVLEVVAIRGESVYVASGWGETADWYQNVLQHPAVTLKLGSKTQTATAERVMFEDARSVVTEYQSKHPGAFKRLASFMLDDPGDSPAASVENLVRIVPLLKITPD